MDDAGGTEKIDIEVIMDDIRRDISERGIKDECLSFLDIPLDVNKPIITEGSWSSKSKIVRFVYLNFFTKLPVSIQQATRKILKR